jgi:hypothetical protein
MTIDVTEDEAILLREILDGERKEMLHEIHHTSHREYRDLLRQRLARLEALLEQLTPVGALAGR